MFSNDLLDYIHSGHSMLAVTTSEKQRALEDIVSAAKTMDREVFVWSIATGWLNTDMKPACGNDGPPDPKVAMRQVIELPEQSILVLKDFNVYLTHATYPEFDVVIGWLDHLQPQLAADGVEKTLIFLGPEFQAPIAIRDAVTTMEYDLPDEANIERIVRYVCDGAIEEKSRKAYVPPEEIIPTVVSACKGMTEGQVMDRVSLAMRKRHALDPDAVRVILHEKAGVIRASGLLDYRDAPPGGLGVVGGLEALKRHIHMDKPCFSKEARAFGIQPPKGILLVGIPGCGKTLISVSIASEFDFPLISMDVGNLMSKWVGESEANMRQSLKIIDAVSPCVLQMDEVEKGFGGGDLDGGASNRVFGSFLKWLNDRDTAVYVVATANDVSKLPPEFARKGRFDEIFGVELPTEVERNEILKIHLHKRKRSIDKMGDAAPEFVQKTEGFTGADIEAAVVFGLKTAFQEGKELEGRHLITAAEAIVPLSKTEADRIERIKQWCETRAKRANDTKPEERKPFGRASRRVSL